MRADLWRRLHSQLQHERRFRGPKRPAPRREIRCLPGKSLPAWAPRYFALISTGHDQQSACRLAGIHVNTVLKQRKTSLRFVELLMDARAGLYEGERQHLDLLRIARKYGGPGPLASTLEGERTTDGNRGHFDGRTSDSTRWVE